MSAAAKSLPLCPTLCDPIDGSPPGSPVPGILQARTLEWIAISFSNAWKWKVKVKTLSCIRLLATHGLQPTRLLRPWDFPGRSTGVGCHRLLHCYRTLECKSRKSRHTWSNRQIWPWSTQWSRTKTNRVLPGEHTGHSKHPLPTTQEMTLQMGITRWSILKSDWLYYLQLKMEKLYTVSKNKTGSWMWLRSLTYCQIQTVIEESEENQ